MVCSSLLQFFLFAPTTPPPLSLPLFSLSVLSFSDACPLKFSPLKLPYLMAVYSKQIWSHVCAAPGRTPLSWRTRMQIAIDVANALVIYRIMLFFFAGWFH